MKFSESAIKYIACDVAASMAKIPAAFWMSLRKSGAMPLAFTILVRGQVLNVELSVTPERRQGIEDTTQVNEFLVMDVSVDDTEEPSVTNPITATVEMPMIRDEAYSVSSLLSKDCVSDLPLSACSMPLDELEGR